LCGHPKDGCRHKQLQGNADRAGLVGIYNATPNTTGAVLDAIEDTLVTEDEMERQHQENRQRLEALGGSAQKQTTEATIRDRSPTQVRFDTNPEQLNNPLPTMTNRLDSGLTSGTPAQSRRNQIQDWISGLTPPEPVTAHNAPKPQHVLPLARICPALSPADAVPALLQSLIDEFKGLWEGLEVQQRDLAGVAVKADARTTVAVHEGAQRANPTGKGTTSANAVIEDEESVGRLLISWVLIVRLKLVLSILVVVSLASHRLPHENIFLYEWRAKLAHPMYSVS
jgi:hypothetical protein